MERTVQLEFPFAGSPEPTEHTQQGFPEEIANTLPSGIQWTSSNEIVAGGPFVVWSSPQDPDNAVEVSAGLTNVYSTCQSVIRLWPWYEISNYFNPDTGVSGAVAMPFHSAQEMVASSVAPVLYSAVGNLVFTLSSSLVHWSDLSPIQTSSSAGISTQTDKSPSLRKPSKG